MRKFHEVKLFLDARGINVPVIGNVYLLTKGVAKLFNSGKLAGCVVSNKLLKTIEKYAAGPDKGKKFCQELAAKQLAVFKGLGFAAGYLGGIHKADGFGPIIELAESYRPGDWKHFMGEIQFSQPDEFFFFEHDSYTGLADEGRISRAYLDSLRHPPKSKEVNLNYRLSRLVHRWAFTRDQALYPLLWKIFARLDAKPGFLSRMAYRLERVRSWRCTAVRTAAIAACPTAPTFVPKRTARSAAATGPAAARPTAAANWTTRSVSGPGFTSGSATMASRRRCSTGR